MRLTRLVMVTLLALIAVAMYFTGRAMGRDAQQMAIGMVFGALAGVPAMLVVLTVARHAPAADPYEAPGVRDWRPAEQRHADERLALEAEYRNAGTWTVINGRTCYVVPAVDWMGDGEKLETGYGNTWQYYCGDYRSNHQFTIAACLSQFDSVMRRPVIGGWGDWL